MEKRQGSGIDLNLLKSIVAGDYKKETSAEPSSLSVLEEAHALIYGDRNDSYGHPLDDFQCSADILRALVKRRYSVDIPFSADFIGLFMAVGVKGSRQAGRPKRDNLVDGAGYFGCIEMIEAECTLRGKKP